MPHISSKYTITEEAYAEKQAELKKFQTLKNRAEKLKAALDAAFQQDKSNTSRIHASIVSAVATSDDVAQDVPDMSFLKRDNEKNIQKIQRSIVDDLSDVYSFDFMDERDESSDGLEEKKAALHKKLAAILKDEALPHGIKTEAKQALMKLQRISEQQSLATFDSITIKGLLRKIDIHKEELAQKRAAFEDLTARYNALCTMAGEEAKELPFSEDSETTISAEIERLEVALVRQQEQIYIAETVDEVMADMGYDLIGTREVRKKNGKRFRNELFTFDEGTAVNVTFSTDGQISMELGGLAREDRIPTEDEAAVLTHDMETFCGEFAEFEKKLRERGIVVGNRIALSPPSADYAAIININDYAVKESMQISEMNASQKRRKAAEKKAMRRDD